MPNSDGRFYPSLLKPWSNIITRQNDLTQRWEALPIDGNPAMGRLNHRWEGMTVVCHLRLILSLFGSQPPTQRWEACVVARVSNVTLRSYPGVGTGVGGVVARVSNVTLRSYPGVGTGVGGSQRGKVVSHVRFGSWNIGTLTGKSIELVQVLKRRRIQVACVQETRWVGTKAREFDGFKLWNSGSARGRNGVGILVAPELREFVVEVKRISDRLMAIKLVLGGCAINVVRAYAPHVGLADEVKREFWDALDGVVVGFPLTEKVIIGGDFFNGHIGDSVEGFEDVHGDFGFGSRNPVGISLFEFARASDVVVANSCFPKRDDHLATFVSGVGATQIDYLLLRRCDQMLCKDVKVIPSENITIQHKLLVMDVMIRRVKHRRATGGNTQIRWRRLKGEKIFELIKRVQEKVRSKVEAKKVAYLRYMNCNVEEERAALRVEYKKARKEAKLEVTKAKNVAFERLYKDIEEKGGVNQLFRLAKVRERKARDLDHVRCVRGSDGRVLVETAKVAKRWEEYFCELLNAGGDQRLVLDELGQSEASRVYCRCICLEEVARALCGMHSGRALGPDKIPVEFWKHAGRGGWVWLTKLFKDLRRCLESRGVPIAYTRAIKDMYGGARTRVRTSGGDSEPFLVGMGSTLSPFLFTLVMDVLTQGVQEGFPCGRETESEVEVMIDSHLVLKVDKFRYLGSVIQTDGELDGDVGHRVGVAWAKWQLASGVLGDPKISPRMKGKFYRSVVRPAMLYGAECWAVKKSHVRRLHAAEMRMLRWMCGKTRLDRILNEVTRRQVGMASVEVKLREARLR
ncbi:unnamed protein product [Cuscuta campestris]|uniref:Endonuclease/exonuclease/phosphatase domain-containing protein n=1 Tax=Cuscuta campestris TaxID=132261 RepID=A0A484L4H0_9ASTE|nr:unnamed protein product [Cuscuta campestris]